MTAGDLCKHLALFNPDTEVMLHAGSGIFIDVSGFRELAVTCKLIPRMSEVVCVEADPSEQYARKAVLVIL